MRHAQDDIQNSLRGGMGPIGAFDVSAFLHISKTFFLKFIHFLENSALDFLIFCMLKLENNGS